MTALQTDMLWSVWRVAQFCLIVATVAFVVVAGAAWIWFVADEQFPDQHLISRTDTTFQEWHGEIYFGQQQSDLFNGPRGPFEIVAVNRTTGQLRATGQHVDGPPIAFAALPDRLICVGSSEVIVFTATGTRRLALPDTAGRLTPFIHGGRIHAVTVDADWQASLLELVGDEWVFRHRLAILGDHRSWEFDGERQEWRLARRTAQGPVSAIFGQIQVLPIGDVLHIVSKFYTEAGVLVAHRPGLDIIDAQTPSALAPANAPPDTTGWTRINPLLQAGIVALCDHQGQLFLATTKTPSLWRWDTDRRLFTPAGDFDIPFTPSHNANVSVAAVPRETPGDTGLVVIDRYHGLQFSFPQGDNYARAPWKIPGLDEPFVAYGGRLILLTLGLWGVAHLILIAGLPRTWPRRDYVSGLKRVQLARLARRGLARAIDLTIVLIPLIILTTSPWPTSSEEVLTRHEDLVSGLLFIRFSSLQNLPSLMPHATSAIVSLFPALAVGLLVLGVYQAHFGATPGKQWCGLRTVRTTLQPCDRLRSCLRELLIIVDTAFLLTPLPALASILFSPSRQRLADRVCDTVVIEALRKRPTETHV